MYKMKFMIMKKKLLCKIRFYFLEVGFSGNLSSVRSKPGFAYMYMQKQNRKSAENAFVFATYIVQYHPKFQVSSHFLWLYSLVCVDQVGNPEDDAALLSFTGQAFGVD